VPEPLLQYRVNIKGVEVLEGHATLVTKALGGDLKYLAKYLRVYPSEDKLRLLLKLIEPYLEPHIYLKAKDRINRLISHLIEKRG